MKMMFCRNIMEPSNVSWICSSPCIQHSYSLGDSPLLLETLASEELDSEKAFSFKCSPFKSLSSLCVMDNYENGNSCSFPNHHLSLFSAFSRPIFSPLFFPLPCEVLVWQVNLHAVLVALQTVLAASYVKMCRISSWSQEGCISFWGSVFSPTPDKVPVAPSNHNDWYYMHIFIARAVLIKID